ncbi:MAG: hypothetical protein JW841_08825 [Deltaproteobacteria bacterium]|nr:hypothetical protein [Deltaproteobacteria bacterium]
MQQNKSITQGLATIAIHSLIWLFPLYVLIPRFKLWGPIGTDDLIPTAVVCLCAVAILLNIRPSSAIGFIGVSKEFLQRILTHLISTPALLGLVLVIIIASFTTVIQAASLNAAIYGILRVTIRFSLYGVLLLSGRFLLNAKQRRQLIIFLIALAFIEGLFGLVSYIFRIHGPWQTGMLAYPEKLIPEDGRIRVQGTFGGEVPLGESFLNRANFYSAYLVIALMALTSFWAERRRLWLVLITALCITSGILVSYSRMSLAAAVVGFFLAALLTKRWISATITAIMVILAFTAWSPLRERFLEFDTDRIGQWMIALRVIASNFWLGTGDGNYLNSAMQVAQGINVPLVRTPHNSILYATATYGIFAGGALISLYILLLVEAVRRVRHYVTPLSITRLTLVAAFIVHDLTNNLFFIPEVALMFWAIYAATEELSANETVGNNS